MGVPRRIESVTAIENPPLLPSTLSPAVLKLTVDNSERTSRASNDALRRDARERLRRAPVRVRRRQSPQRREPGCESHGPFLRG